MSTGSKIEWTEATWNPITGCSPVSKDCVNCYAGPLSHRLSGMAPAGVRFPFCGRDKVRDKYADLTVHKNGRWQFNGDVKCHADALDFPLTLKKPRTIFVCSMSDLYHPKVPFEFVDKVFAVMALCPQHTFQVLTKRPGRMVKYLDATTAYSFGNHYGAWIDAAHEVLGIPDGEIDATIAPRIRSAMDEGLRIAGMKCGTYLRNVWLGTTIETAEQLPRIAELLKYSAAVRFLSLEPLLGPIALRLLRGWDETEYEEYALSGTIKFRQCPIDWIIVGGESGPGARACEIENIRSIVRQCRAAGVAVFVKQLGAHPTLDGKPLKLKHRNGKDMTEWPEDLRIREMPQTEAANA